MNDNSSLAHTKWNCKYHIVFAPKYRRKIFYGEHREEIGKILRELCNWKQVNIVQADAIKAELKVSSIRLFFSSRSSSAIILSANAEQSTEIECFIGRQRNLPSFLKNSKKHDEKPKIYDIIIFVKIGKRM